MSSLLQIHQGSVYLGLFVFPRGPWPHGISQMVQLLQPFYILLKLPLTLGLQILKLVSN